MAEKYSEKFNEKERIKTAFTDYKQGVEDATRWISVKESLPEEEERVLVREGNRWMNLGRYMNVGSTYKEDKRWICGNTNRDWNVTHWRRIL